MRHIQNLLYCLRLIAHFVYVYSYIKKVFMIKISSSCLSKQREIIYIYL